MTKSHDSSARHRHYHNDHNSDTRGMTSSRGTNNIQHNNRFTYPLSSLPTELPRLSMSPKIPTTNHPYPHVKQQHPQQQKNPHPSIHPVSVSQYSQPKSPNESSSNIQVTSVNHRSDHSIVPNHNYQKKNKASSSLSIRFEDPDRYHPITYSILLVLGVLVVLPALLSYMTLRNALQQQQVCWVGPATTIFATHNRRQARQMNPTRMARMSSSSSSSSSSLAPNHDDDPENHVTLDFLQPLYGAYHVIRYVDDTDDNDDRQKLDTIDASISRPNNLRIDNEKNNPQHVWKLWQSMSTAASTTMDGTTTTTSSTSPNIFVVSYPFMARQFWSVTTVANTLTSPRLLHRISTALKPQLQPHNSVLPPGGTTSSASSLSSSQEFTSSLNSIVWDQFEQMIMTRNGDGDDTASSSTQHQNHNNRWCLIPNSHLAQAFADERQKQQRSIHHHYNRIQPQKQYQNNPSMMDSATKIKPPRLQKSRRLQVNESTTSPYSSSSSSSSSPWDMNHNNSIEAVPTTHFDDATAETVANKGTSSSSSAAVPTPTNTTTTLLGDKTSNMAWNIYPQQSEQHFYYGTELIRYQICSRVEPTLVLSHLPPYDWPVRPPPNGVWSQSELVLRSSSSSPRDADRDHASTSSSQEPKRTTTTTTFTVNNNHVLGDDDTVLNTAYYRQQTPRYPLRDGTIQQVHVSCFMKDITNTMAASTGNNNNDNRNLSSPAASFPSWLLSNSTKTPTTWIIIILLVWNQCTYRKLTSRRRRGTTSSSSRKQPRQTSIKPLLSQQLQSDEMTTFSSSSSTSSRPQQPKRKRRQHMQTQPWQSRHLIANNNNHHIDDSQPSRNSSSLTASRSKPSGVGVHAVLSSVVHPIVSMVTAMSEQFVHDSWKELIWNMVWLYLVASKLERDFLGGLVLLSVYISFGWGLALVKVIFMTVWDQKDCPNHRASSGGNVGVTINVADEDISQELASHFYGSSRSTASGQVGIIVALVILLAQYASSFAVFFDFLVLDSLPVIYPNQGTNANGNGGVPALYLNFLPAIVIAPYLLLFFPSGNNYVWLLVGIILPAVLMGWVMSWNGMIDVLALPQWVIPATLLLHLILIRWRKKLACCTREGDDGYERDIENCHTIDEYRPLFPHAHQYGNRALSDDEQSGQWTLVGGNKTTVTTYTRQTSNNNDDETVVSLSHKTTEVVRKGRPCSGNFAAVVWILLGFGLTMLPLYLSVSLDVTLMLGHVTTLLLFVPVLWHWGGGTQPPAEIFLQYHMASTVTLVVVQIMTLTAWNVANVPMMALSWSSSANYDQNSLVLHPAGRQIIQAWVWLQSAFNNFKIGSSSSSTATAGGNDMEDPTNVAYHQHHAGDLVILAQVVLICQISWHFMSLMVTASRERQRNEQLRDKIGNTGKTMNSSEAASILGSDRRDVGLWFALQVVAEEFRLWYEALTCR